MTVGTVILAALFPLGALFFRRECSRLERVSDYKVFILLASRYTRSGVSAVNSIGLTRI